MLANTVLAVLARAAADPVNPFARKVHQGLYMVRFSQDSISNWLIWLVEAASRCFAFLPATWRMAGAHTKPVGVVRIFVARQPAKHELSQRCLQRVLSITPRSLIVKEILRHRSQYRCLIRLPVRQQPCIARDLGTVKLRPQTAVKNDP